MFEKSSMLYWWPIIKDLDIPKPKTEIINTEHISHDTWVDFIDGKKVPFDLKEIYDICKSFGYPLFIRTDEISGKHNWENTCFVKNENDILQHLRALVEESFLSGIMGLPVNAIVIREYVPMMNLFTAFHGKMPVNPEIRIFIKNGDVLCWHWYWIKDAIENASVENWLKILEDEEQKISSQYELEPLKCYAYDVTDTFKEGYWSVDFCKSNSNIWYLIDMAEGDKSWHPDSCAVLKIYRREVNKNAT